MGAYNSSAVVDSRIAKERGHDPQYRSASLPQWCKFVHVCRIVKFWGFSILEFLATALVSITVLTFGVGDDIRTGVLYDIFCAHYFLRFFFFAKKYINAI